MKRQTSVLSFTLRAVLVGGLIGWMGQAGCLNRRIAAAPDGGWNVLRHCRLIPHAGNDGDSFHVRHENRHYIFRLYFVDAPETDGALMQRMSQQAAYWGISTAQVRELGLQAAAVAREQLDGTFTVYTKFVDARGRSSRKRYFAFVDVEGAYLAEELVARGLARVYGFRDRLPDGISKRRFLRRLQAAEAKAKKQRRGAWGIGRSPLISK